MASGEPVTSSLTAPQKQLPKCVMTLSFQWVRPRVLPRERTYSRFRRAARE
jgi:hypothetical protein